jgi:nucleoside-diphosphate-sugar epimerase
MHTPVLVTGGAGFIGSHLIDSLLAAGTPVICVDRRGLSEQIVQTNLGHAVKDQRLTYYEADLANADLSDLLEQCEVVFHLAAVPGVRESWGENFSAYVQSNVLATHRLMAACAMHGVRRVVVASSSSVYGSTVYGSTNHRSTETDQTRPISPYGVTKLASEQLCLAHASRPEAKCSVVALRYFTVYGPRQRPEMLISRLLHGIVHDLEVPIFGDGRQRREFTYVSDVVDATVAAASSDVQNVAINVGGGASLTVNELLGVIRQVTGRTVRTVRKPMQAGDVTATSADLTRALTALNFKPKVRIDDGVREQYRWLASLGESDALLPQKTGSSFSEATK